MVYVMTEHTVVCEITNEALYIKVKGKGHPITGHQGPRGGVEV
jgi:hypothetical protein